MKEYYDVVVVGAGPSGAMAAWHAALGGASVLLLEKDRDIGLPLRCAEGVGADDLKKLVEPQSQFIANVIDGVNIIAPNGTKIRVQSEKKGYILHRALFDRYLAEQAAKAGADVQTKCNVTGLLFEDGAVNGVTYEHFGKTFTVRCSIVIGADGVESRVGRWAGIRTHLKPSDIETCLQVTLADIEVEKNVCDFYVSGEWAPQGYAWVFPKGEGKANVGLGISGLAARKHSPLYYLRRFVGNFFPQASVLTTAIGSVPSARTVKPMVKARVLLVGDAARQSNPLTGGGIVNGMIGGKMAGMVAAEAVQNGSFSDKFLRKYEKLWEQEEGKTHRIFYQMKKAIFKMSDDQFNHAAEALLEMEPEQRTVGKIFATVLRTKPSLILDALYVFKEYIGQPFTGH